MGLRTVFFGTPEFAETVLRGLLASPHEVVGVVTAPDRPAGRGRKVRRGPVATLASERELPLVQPYSLRDPGVQARLGGFRAEVFAVASYGLIFPRAALAIPRLGVLNAHASILPALRGAAPVERAILAGLKETGVSVQRMVRRVDAGDVHAVRRTPVGAREDSGSLRSRLAAIAAELLPEVLTQIESGAAAARPQDEAMATRAPPLRPEERAISWSEAAAAIDRRVRAFAPRPGAFVLEPAELGAKRMKILAVEPSPGGGEAGSAAPGEVLAASAREGLCVAAGRGALRLLTIQPEGGRPMDAPAFVRGHAVRPGMRLRDGLDRAAVP